MERTLNGKEKHCARCYGEKMERTPTCLVCSCHLQNSANSREVSWDEGLTEELLKARTIADTKRLIFYKLIIRESKRLVALEEEIRELVPDEKYNDDIAFCLGFHTGLLRVIGLIKEKVDLIQEPLKNNSHEE